MCSVQKNLLNSKVDSDILKNKRKTIEDQLLEKEIKKLRDQLNEVITIKDNEIEELKKDNYSFIYNNKLIIFDDNENLVMKYKAPLIQGLIEELEKLCKWLDKRSSYLKIPTGYDNYHITITKEEIENIIIFLKKLNDIQDDNASDTESLNKETESVIDFVR